MGIRWWNVLGPKMEPAAVPSGFRFDVADWSPRLTNVTSPAGVRGGRRGWWWWRMGGSILLERRPRPVKDEATKYEKNPKIKKWIRKQLVWMNPSNLVPKTAKKQNKKQNKTMKTHPDRGGTGPKTSFFFKPNPIRVTVRAGKTR